MFLLWFDSCESSLEAVAWEGDQGEKGDWVPCELSLPPDLEGDHGERDDFPESDPPDGGPGSYENVDWEASLSVLASADPSPLLPLMSPLAPLLSCSESVVLPPEGDHGESGFPPPPPLPPPPPPDDHAFLTCDEPPAGGMDELSTRPSLCLLLPSTGRLFDRQVNDWKKPPNPVTLVGLDDKTAKT